MRRVTDGIDCSTFRFGPSGQILDSRQQDMDSGTNYRWFCLHVRNVIAAICGVELALLIWMFVAHNKYPMTVCQTLNVSSTVNEVPSIRSPIQLTVQERRSCSTYSLILIFTIFHACCDFVTLVGILVKKHNFVLPLIILLVSNIVVSAIFLLNSLITYMYSGAHFSSYFLFFVVVQTIVRYYEVSCARKLYWFFRWASDERYMPQSSLLKPDDTSPFQF